MFSVFSVVNLGPRNHPKPGFYSTPNTSRPTADPRGRVASTPSKPQTEALNFPVAENPPSPAKKTPAGLCAYGRFP